MTTDQHQTTENQENSKQSQPKLPPGVISVPLTRRPGMGHGPVVHKHPPGQNNVRVGGVTSQNIHPKDEDPKNEK